VKFAIAKNVVGDIYASKHDDDFKTIYVNADTRHYHRMRGYLKTETTNLQSHSNSVISRNVMRHKLRL